MLENKRKSVLVLGIVFAVLAAYVFIYEIIGAISYRDSYVNDDIWSAPEFMDILYSLALILMIAALVAMCVMQLSEGKRLKKMGIKGQWSTLCGVGDILLAISLSSIAVSNGITSFAFNADNILTFDFEVLNVIYRVLNLVFFVFCIGAGVMYLISGIRQKRMGKTNILLLIAGVIFVAYSLIEGVRILLQAIVPPDDPFDINEYCVRMILFSTMMFVMYGLRGLAPLLYQKTALPPQFGQLQYGQQAHPYPTIPQQSYSEPPAVPQSYTQAPPAPHEPKQPWQ